MHILYKYYAYNGQTMLSLKRGGYRVSVNVLDWVIAHVFPSFWGLMILKHPHRVVGHLAGGSMVSASSKARRWSMVTTALPCVFAASHIGWSEMRWCPSKKAAAIGLWWHCSLWNSGTAEPGHSHQGTHCGPSKHFIAIGYGWNAVAYV